MELQSAACANDAARLDEVLRSTNAASVNARVGPREETALHAACRSADGNVACCELLLAAGADPSVLCVHGGTCLHQAAQFVNDGALVAMLQHCPAATLAAVANVQDKNGWTALHAAVYKPSRSGPTPHSRTRIVQELLRAQADIGIRNAAGQTTLELAVASECHDGAQAIAQLCSR
jgi:ankyrin repeat protein